MVSHEFNSHFKKKKKKSKKTNQNYLVLKYNMEKYIKVLQIVIICQVGVILPVKIIPSNMGTKYITNCLLT